MPIYEYELCDGDCTVWGKFTLNRPLSAKPADELSRLQKAGAQGFLQLQFAAKLKPLSISDAKRPVSPSSKRSGKGEYERQ